jgi:hypothetical protein
MNEAVNYVLIKHLMNHVLSNEELLLFFNMIIYRNLRKVIVDDLLLALIMFFDFKAKHFLYLSFGAMENLELVSPKLLEVFLSMSFGDFLLHRIVCRINNRF